MVVLCQEGVGDNWPRNNYLAVGSLPALSRAVGRLVSPGLDLATRSFAADR